MESERTLLPSRVFVALRRELQSPLSNQTVLCSIPPTCKTVEEFAQYLRGHLLVTQPPPLDIYVAGAIVIGYEPLSLLRDNETVELALCRHHKKVVVSDDDSTSGDDSSDSSENEEALKSSTNSATQSRANKPSSSAGTAAAAAAAAAAASWKPTRRGKRGGRNHKKSSGGVGGTSADGAVAHSAPSAAMDDESHAVARGKKRGRESLADGGGPIVKRHAAQQSSVSSSAAAGVTRNSESKVFGNSGSGNGGAPLPSTRTWREAPPLTVDLSSPFAPLSPGVGPSAPDFSLPDIGDVLRLSTLCLVGGAPEMSDARVCQVISVDARRGVVRVRGVEVTAGASVGTVTGEREDVEWQSVISAERVPRRSHIDRDAKQQPPLLGSSSHAATSTLTSSSSSACPTSPPRQSNADSSIAATSSHSAAGGGGSGEMKYYEPLSPLISGDVPGEAVPGVAAAPITLGPPYGAGGGQVDVTSATSGAGSSNSQAAAGGGGGSNSGSTTRRNGSSAGGKRGLGRLAHLLASKSEQSE